MDLMKKFALALMASAAAIFGMGMVANAYPPGGQSITISDDTPPAGSTFTVTAACTAGEDVTFTLGGSTDTESCSATTAGFTLFATPAAGSATGTLTAPTTAGTFTGTASGTISGDLGTFAVTVAAQTAPTDSLPATGSDGVGTTTWIAAGLLLAGLGLFGVASMRRRSATA